jgi:hypothetical protein
MKLIALEKDVPGIADSAFTDELLKQEAARAWEVITTVIRTTIAQSKPTQLEIQP